MIWIAPSGKDTDNAALKKRLWGVVDQAVPASHFAEVDYSRVPPRPELLAHRRSPLYRPERQIEYSAPRSESNQSSSNT